MKDNQAKYPQLRFKGFTDPWEQRKLTEIVNRVNKFSNSDVLPKVEFEDIVSGEGRLNKDISSKFDSRKGTLFEPGNILYGKLRPYLKNWLFPEFEGVALGDFWVFEATDVSVPSFDYYLIQSDNYQKVANDTSGTKMPRSDWKSISSTDFAIPSKDEQKQIGAFFKQLDDTITLHQRKLAKLKELKQGYLQKMFPQNGSKFPQLRFAGFADAWEQRKLGDFVIIRSGWSPSNFDINNNANNLFIKVDDLNYSTRVQEESQVKVNILSKYKKMKKSSTIFPKRGAAIMTNKVRMLGEDSYMDTNMMALEPKGIDPEYLYTFINKTGLYKIADTSTIPQINNKHIEPYLLLIPSLEEQHKIGSFFKQLDGTIALHQRKLEKLQELKKGYLQKMFC
ncbi:restriction endonuclease subunit S [Levilactobacillus brevis]|uniref:restriction endonuclease subunit S n=3 Tax=Levilactobacillus brevis TaxID=1580 RepID=UPI0022E22999|nr:restriction endonuclease subunit S [Levilactobacillus brevis]